MWESSVFRRGDLLNIGERTEIFSSHSRKMRCKFLHNEESYYEELSGGLRGTDDPDWSD